jgi:protein HIRA/HIR1
VCVRLLGKFRDLQRLTVQYARILDMTAGEEDDEGANGNGSADSMDLEE